MLSSLQSRVLVTLFLLLDTEPERAAFYEEPQLLEPMENQTLEEMTDIYDSALRQQEELSEESGQGEETPFASLFSPKTSPSSEPVAYTALERETESQIEALYALAAQEEPAAGQNSQDESRSQTLCAEEKLSELKSRMEQQFLVSSPAQTPRMTQFRCAVHGTQSVKMGERVVLRLKSELALSDALRLNPGSVVYAILASCSQFRAQIELDIDSPGGEILHFAAWSTDGMQGVPLRESPAQATIQEQSGEIVARELDEGISALTGGVVRSAVSAVRQARRNHTRQEVVLVDEQLLIFKEQKR